MPSNLLQLLILWIACGHAGVATIFYVRSLYAPELETKGKEWSSLKIFAYWLGPVALAVGLLVNLTFWLQRVYWRVTKV